MIETQSRPSTTGTEGVDVHHLVCCGDEIAICGLDVSEVEYQLLLGDDAPCVVCYDPEVPCPTCKENAFGEKVEL